MRFLASILFFLASAFMMGQNQLWKGYFSYNTIRAVTATNNKVFVATENAVFVVQDEDQEVLIYNTINGFKINDITTLAYSADYKKIIVGSRDGNVALIDEETGSIFLLSDIYNKNSLSASEKEIHDIYVYAGFAYLATGYGITAVRLNDAHFGDSYYIGDEGDAVLVRNVTVLGQYIYANIEGLGIKRALLNSNLINYDTWENYSYENWRNIVNFDNRIVGVKDDLSLNYFENDAVTQFGEVDEGFIRLTAYGNELTAIASETSRSYDINLNPFFEFTSTSDTGSFNTALMHNGNLLLGSTAKGLFEIESNTGQLTKISPTGAISNDFFRILTTNDNKVWTIYGGYDEYFNPYTNGLTEYGINRLNLNNNNWEEIPYEFIAPFKATAHLSINPREPNTLYVSSFFNGMIKIGNANGSIDDMDVTVFNHTNSALESIPDTDGDVRINGPAFDSQGNGWVMNNFSSSPIKRFTPEGEWQSYTGGSQTTDGQSYTAPVTDRNNTKWFGSLRSGIIGFNEQNNKAIKVEGLPSGGSGRAFAVAIDNRNQLWIGSEFGLRVIPSADSFLNNTTLNANSIVIMEDGLAQELFYRQNILKIKVDGSNNKWVSVAGAGVFLVDENGQNTIYHFDNTNSPLPHNDVVDIDINDQTGEVFFATKSGMVSFQNYATTPSENLNNVYIYPNPLRPGSSDVVNIAGLSSESTIKITDISGNLVYETKSAGGTVQWNTTSINGAKVKSGVYMVFVSSLDGTDTTVKKVMIIR